MKMLSNMIQKSRLAPTALSTHESYMIIGDKYVKNYLVTRLPKEFGLGMLSAYVRNPSIKVFMQTNVLSLDCASMLKKEHNAKMQEFNKTTDPSIRETLRADIVSLDTYIQEIIMNKDKTLNVLIVFQIQANSKSELDETAKSFKTAITTDGFNVIGATLIQDKVLKMATPLFTNSQLPKVVEDNLGVPLPSLSVAGLYPFIFDTLKDTNGFILGNELNNNGIIIVDQFFYLNNPLEAKLQNRLNGNMILVGSSGSGKTTALNMFVRFYLRQKRKLIWIDPENKNRALTKKYNGTYIDWGKKGNVINVFDLHPISVEEDEDDSIKWDTEQAIFNVIEDIKIIVRYLKPSVNDDTLTMISEVTFHTFEKKGIDIHKSFKGISHEKYPIFTDFKEAIEDLIQKYIDEKKTKRVELMEDLLLKIEPCLNEYGVYFNGHTTIDLTSSKRNIVAFGTKTLYDRTDELKNALSHLMYRYAWSLCLDETEASAFVLDEASGDMQNETTAKIISQFVRRSRKYNNICSIATQEPKDYANGMIFHHGEAIFNNSVYKLIFMLEENAIQDLAKLMKLNDSEIQLIEDFYQGEALFVCGNKHIPIHVLPTENELREMGM